MGTRKRNEKRLSKLYYFHKQQAELNAFDENLRHYADQRISQVLDDGVKVNYGKFGDLLAEVKQVVGNKQLVYEMEEKIKDFSDKTKNINESNLRINNK